MHLKDLKKKAPADLVSMAEELGGEAAGLPGELEIVDCIARGAGGAVFPALVGAHESQARTGLVCAIESRPVRHSRTL